MSKIEVEREELLQAYADAKSIIKRLQYMLAGVGCLHSNKTNVTTMGGSDDVQTWYCNDCGETFDGVK